MPNVHIIGDSILSGPHAEREIDDIVAFMKTLNDGWQAMKGDR